MYETEAVLIPMPGGTFARGYVSTGPDIEAIELRHLMSDGSYATEIVWRAVEQAPPPPAAPADPTQTPEAPGEDAQ